MNKMSVYMRKTVSLHKKISVSQTTSFLKFSSAFSPTYDVFSSSNVTNKFTNKKLNQLRQIGPRYFSLQSVQSIYDSITSSEASKITQQILLDIHDLPGVSWSFTIIITSVAMKLLFSFPFGMYQQYLISKLELTKVELDGIARRLKEKILVEAYKNRWSEAKFRKKFHENVKEQWKILIVKNNCHPFKITILFFIQFPFWLLLTLTLRKFANDVYAGQSEFPEAALQFQVGGPFWSKNLALPDPTYTLPIINFLSILAYAELFVLSKTHEKITKNSIQFFINKIHLNFLRIFAVAFFFISAASPSGLSLFWATNSLFALAQNLICMSPRVRRFFKIPLAPSEVNKPYREAWNNFLEKYSKFIFKKK